MIIGVDASRSRSGGAKAHLTGIMTAVDPTAYGVSAIHLWAYEELLDLLPSFPWLVKHCPPETRKSLSYQVRWQFNRLHQEARCHQCDLMFNTDAGSVSRFLPCVTLSQDMLSFEGGEMQRFGWSIPRLRLLLLRYIQSRSLRISKRAIFLTQYAADTIQKVIGSVPYSVINHGIGQEFYGSHLKYKNRVRCDGQVTCLYVSNAAMYKHQWHVVRAIGLIKRAGINVKLLLVGGGKGRAQALLDSAVFETDPGGTYIKQEPYVKHATIPKYFGVADLFIFASSCENMPITLMEAMASGIPIACSDRGPMPEVLRDGGLYFNPEDPVSIAKAVQTLILDTRLSHNFAERATSLAACFSWSRCAAETWQLLGTVAAHTKRSCLSPII